MEDNLSRIAREYTFCNTVGIVEEVKRYKEIADYFAKKSNRERFNKVNQKYLEEMHARLLTISDETLPEHISNLCSKLLKRFDSGII